MMVDMIKDLQDQGIPSYADFHVAGVNCDKITPGQLPIDYPDDSQYLVSLNEIKEREFPKGSVVFLDELIKEFDNRMTMGTGKETKYRARLTQAFMQIGKKHLRVVHAEQITRTIDWRIAYLSELFLVPRPTAYKIVDKEVINVEFDITPVVNEGIFGFHELPHYYMDEERFWYHAFDYDSDEPVMSETEKVEAKAKKRKLDHINKELANHEKNLEHKETPAFKKSSSAKLKQIADNEKLRQLAINNPIQEDVSNSAQQTNTAGYSDYSKVLGVESLDSIIRDTNKGYSQDNKNIPFRYGESGHEIKSFSNNINESQFYQWLNSVRAA